jgi:hypothetical protein
MGSPVGFMHPSTVYCPAHGLFSRHAVVDQSCPKCGRQGETILAFFASLTESLDVLTDPKRPTKAFLALRQIAVAVHSGWLTMEEAARAATRILARCSDLVTVTIAQNAYSELAELLGEILQARFHWKEMKASGTGPQRRPTTAR